MQVASSVPLARTWSYGSSCKKPGKCSLYFGQPCAQNAILEKHGDSVERELAVGHHHLSHETHSLASLPQLETLVHPPVHHLLLSSSHFHSEGGVMMHSERCEVS